MKTIKEIDSEINLKRELLKELYGRDFEAMKAEIVFLKNCKLYLETNPRPEFIKESLDFTKSKIEILEARFFEWQTSKNMSQYKNPRQTYFTEAGMPHLKAQLKTLNYLLNRTI